MRRTITSLLVFIGWAGALTIACETIPHTPQIAVSARRSDGTTFDLVQTDGGVSADGGSQCPTAANGNRCLTANGLDRAVITLSAANVDPSDTNTYAVSLEPADTLVSVVAQANAASANGSNTGSSASDGGASSTTISSPGGQGVTRTLSLGQRSAYLDVVAGLDYGTTLVHLSYGNIQQDYCGCLQRTTINAINLQLAGVADGVAPKNWIAYDVIATLPVKLGSPSNGTTLHWTATDCGYFAADDTVTKGGGSVSNRLFLPAGYDTMTITVSDNEDVGPLPDGGSANLSRTVCLTPQGVGTLKTADGTCQATTPTPPGPEGPTTTTSTTTTTNFVDGGTVTTTVTSSLDAGSVVGVRYPCKQ